MTTNISKDDWKEAKAHLKKKWHKLTERDLRHIAEDNSKLSEALEKHYSYTTEDAVMKAKEFFQNHKRKAEHGHAHDESEFLENLNETAHRVGAASKEAFRKTREIADHLKDDASKYSKDVAKFIDEKPYQSLIIAALSGFVLGSLLSKK